MRQQPGPDKPYVKQGREPNWIVQAVVIALINQVTPSILTVMSTLIIFIKAGLVDANHINLEALLVATVVALAISFISFVLGVRYSIQFIVRQIGNWLSGNAQTSNRGAMSRGIRRMEMAIWWLVALPEIVSNHLHLQPEIWETYQATAHPDVDDPNQQNTD